MKTTSIRRRLILSLTAVIAAFWLLAAALGMMVMQDEFGEIFDSSLQETAQRLTPLIVDDLYQRKSGGDTRMVGETSADVEEEYLTYQARDASGRVIIHSRDAPIEPFPAPLQPGFFDTPTQRIFTEGAIGATLFVQVADSLDHRSEAVLEGGMALLLPLLGIIPVSILAVWLIVGRMLTPIDALREAIGSKDGGNLAPLDTDPLPRELKSIARSVNLLLGRLRSALDAEREFTANSAHELRTPIAGALAQTQVLIAELPAGPEKNRAGLIETALLKLGRLTEKLMQLARAEAGIGTSEQAIDLKTILDVVVVECERERQDAPDIHVHADEATTLVRNIDVDAFAIVMRNLLENALSHGDPDADVDVFIEPGGTVRIVNGGTVVAPEVLQGLKSRFTRGDTKAIGSGLGLAIADRLMQQMGGSLDLRSPASGRADGFEARIVLP